MGEIARGGRYEDWSRNDRRGYRSQERRRSYDRGYDRGRDYDRRHEKRRDSRSRSRERRRRDDERREYERRERDRREQERRDYERREQERREQERREYERKQREHEEEEGKKKDASQSSGSTGSDSTRDDEIIHFDWEPGKTLGSGDRYTMHKIFGDGTFGRCLHCTDQRDRPVAIKVIRDIPRYVDNAKIEVEVLEAIRKADPEGRSYCVHLLETFFHRQFFCLVFEPAAGSLYDLIKENNYRGMWVEDIQTVGMQVAKALEFCAGINLTHTDLKPENILFQHSKMETSHLPRKIEDYRTGGGGRGHHQGPYLRPVRADIKVIDFGNATFAKDHHASIINTRQYRGPEVILGMGWDESSDIWSLGCILMELYGGELFFSTHENLEHLALMEKVLGPMSDSFTRRARSPARGKLLNRDGRVNWPEGASSPSSCRHVQRTPPLAEQVEQPVHRALAHVVQDMLQYDPAKRPTASQVLRDPFFREKIPEA